MSNIRNKNIEQKLKSMLSEQKDIDLSRFDDDSAIITIFSHYEDLISFNDLAIDRYLQEIQELKVHQVQLKLELQLYKERQNELNSNKQSDQHHIQSKEREKYQQNIKELLKIIQSQKEEIKQFQRGKQSLEKKVFEYSEKYNDIEKKKFELNHQLESYMAKDQENQKTITRLDQEKVALTRENEQNIKRYQEEFILKLTNTLKKEYEERQSQRSKLNQQLQKQLKEQEELVREIVQKVSQIFKITAQQDITKWLDSLNAKLDHYQSEIKDAVRQDLKEVKNPIKLLADHHKKQIKSRELLISKFLNK